MPRRPLQRSAPLSVAAGAGKARQMPDCPLVVEKLMTKATTAAAPGPDSQALDMGLCRGHRAEARVG